MRESAAGARACGEEDAAAAAASQRLGS
jgi:hypothetical protein